MEELVRLAVLVEQCLLSSGYSPEDIALLKDTPFESFDQVKKILKEIKPNAENK